MRVSVWATMVGYWRARMQRALDVQDGMLHVQVEKDERGQMWAVSVLNPALRVPLLPGARLHVRWWR